MYQQIILQSSDSAEFRLLSSFVNNIEFLNETENDNFEINKKGNLCIKKVTPFIHNNKAISIILGNHQVNYFCK